jgi:response regulator RpfG family c-di-GMP phosphodiesterase
MNEDLKILVVDDEKSILDIFSEFIGSHTNHTVLTANDGLEALEIIEKEDVDCCFTDLSMPRLDGLELARRIYQHDNTIPIIVMTGYPSMETAIETLKNGVADFLTKPLRMDQILPTIARVMSARSLFVDNILLKEEAEKSKKLLKINQELQAKVKEVETVNLILQKLEQATTSKDLFNTLVKLSGKVTGCDEAHFCFYSQGMKGAEIITSFYRDENNKGVDNECIEKSFIEKVAKDCMPYLIRGKNRTDSILAIPLKIRSKVFGVLISIIREGRYSFSEKDLYFLNFLTENVSGNLHDIGKIGIPDDILLKSGRLTDEEFDIIKKHPIIGSNIIGHLGMWTDEQKIIRHHHERFDGNGYPDRLKGEGIPLLSRILSVADVYDALTTDRSYRKKMSDHMAVKIIKENASSQFDSEIVDIFLELHNEGSILLRYS